MHGSPMDQKSLWKGVIEGSTEMAVGEGGLDRDGLGPDSQRN